MPIYQGYPNPGCFTHSGSTNIVDTADTVVGLDTETIAHADYTLAAGVITVATGGCFCCMYSIPVNDDGSTGAQRCRVYAWLEQDSGGGYQTVVQSHAQDYARETSGGQGVSTGFLVDIGDGDDIRLMVRASTTTDISTESGQAQLSIFRVATSV